MLKYRNEDLAGRLDVCIGWPVATFGQHSLLPQKQLCVEQSATNFTEKNLGRSNQDSSVAVLPVSRPLRLPDTDYDREMFEYLLGSYDKEIPIDKNNVKKEAAFEVKEESCQSREIGSRHPDFHTWYPNANSKYCQNLVSKRVDMAEDEESHSHNDNMCPLPLLTGDGGGSQNSSNMLQVLEIQQDERDAFDDFSFLDEEFVLSPIDSVSPLAHPQNVQLINNYLLGICNNVDLVTGVQYDYDLQLSLQAARSVGTKNVMDNRELCTNLVDIRQLCKNYEEKTIEEPNEKTPFSLDRTMNTISSDDHSSIFEDCQLIETTDKSQFIHENMQLDKDIKQSAPQPGACPFVEMEHLNKTYLLQNGYFDMPIKEAAKKLHVGLSQMKRACRRLGIARWPSRKRESLRNIMQIVDQYLSDDREKRRMMMALQNELESLRGQRGVDLRDEVKSLRQYIFKLNHKRRKARTPEAKARLFRNSPRVELNIRKKLKAVVRKVTMIDDDRDYQDRTYPDMDDCDLGIEEEAWFLEFSSPIKRKAKRWSRGSNHHWGCASEIAVSD